MKKIIFAAALLLFIFALGFFCGTYRYASHKITIERIPPIILQNKALPKEWLKDVDDDTKKSIQEGMKALPDVHHPHTRKLTFGSLVILANDDFSNYVFAKKGSDGEAQWIVSEYRSDDSIHTSFYGPNGYYSPIGLGGCVFLRKINTDEVTSIHYYGGTDSDQNTYVDKDMDGLWDLWIHAKDGVYTHYKREGINWVLTSDDAEE